MYTCILVNQTSEITVLKIVQYYNVLFTVILQGG